MATIAPVVVGITINYGQVLARLGLATVCGAAVGMQRELDNHAAGLRTHTLVCVGACMFMITGAYGFSQFQTELGIRNDPARIAAQAVSGIGFLGAGAIFKQGQSIKGLTTAASLWVTTSLGLACGVFYWFPVLCVLAIAIATLEGMKWFERWVLGKTRLHEFSVEGVHPEKFGQLVGKLHEEKCKVSRVDVQKSIEYPDMFDVLIRCKIPKGSKAKRVAETLYLSKLSKGIILVDGNEKTFMEIMNREDFNGSYTEAGKLKDALNAKRRQQLNSAGSSGAIAAVMQAQAQKAAAAEKEKKATATLLTPVAEHANSDTAAASRKPDDAHTEPILHIK